MKKVLILTKDFYPSSKVASFRSYGWYKYLFENGYYPVIVTSAENIQDENLQRKMKSDEGEVLYAKYYEPLNIKLERKYTSIFSKLIRKTVSLYIELTIFLFNNKYRSNIYNEAKDYLQKNKDVRLIIATGGPFILFKFADLLSREYEIKWAGDYRDTWTQSRSRNKLWITRKMNLYFESKYANRAHFITTVSDYLKILISRNIKTPIHVIPNGYNDWNFTCKNTNEEPKENLEIGFAGSIYPHHPIESFLSGLNELLVSDNINIKVYFYGVNIKTELNTLIKQKFPNLSININFINRLSNKELISRMQKHHLLLVFNEYRITGTKIFEYLALRRKILLCYTNDREANELHRLQYIIKGASDEDLIISRQREIIDKTDSGISLINQKELILTLKNLFKKLNSNNGRLGFTSGDISDYSRRKQTKDLAKIIDNANI